MLAVASADNSITVWDLSVEEDKDAMAAAQTGGGAMGASGGANAALQGEVPPQLLFVHRGQVDPKELRFHPQVPGVIASTAADGFNVFLCESLAPSQEAREKLADAAEAAEAAAMARAGIAPAAAANGAGAAAAMAPPAAPTK